MPSQPAIIERPPAKVTYFDPRQSTSSDQKEQFIVIGSGPVGISFVQEILKRKPDTLITVFGNEPYQPYNRVQLSSVLAGDTAREDIHLSLPDPEKHSGFEYRICRITDIDRGRRQVTDSLGRHYRYDKLIIATGSRAFVPSIPGIQQTGVYTFRNLKDTDALYARISSSKKIVVVGGGLLGIEAARALLRFNTQVILVHQSHRLMNRQLDDEAALRLQNKIDALGITVITESGVREVNGEARVSGVTLRDGTSINCDTVLFCTGISINTELAVKARLKINRGIVVNDKLQTSDSAIYAIGECCEHNGETYGLVKPGFEQAAVAADALSGGQAEYAGSLSVARLKVVGEQVCSMGEVSDFGRHSLNKEACQQSDQHYRKLITHRGRLIGAVGIGAWPELPRIQELYQHKRRIWPWQQWYFKLTGKLWFGEKTNDVNLWPRQSIVCQCNNITQGTLVEAIDSGCDNQHKLSEATTAGTVCGSCKPMLQQLLGYQAPQQKETGAIAIAFSCILALIIISAIAFTPAMQTANSVQQPALFESIWNDKFWKQVSGFSLLGLSLIGLLMSIRKRTNSQRMGDFAYWRLLHLGLGVSCAATLILHTGFHLGSNLNQILMVDFLLVIGLGAVAGVMISLSHKLSPVKSQRYRKALSWLHILVTWPLPILLSLHILTVYYF